MGRVGAHRDLGVVYAHWRGRFYPRDLPTARFEFCAAHFDTVELDDPFAMPFFGAYERRVKRRQIPIITLERSR